MAQSVVLAPGQGAATSTDIVVGPGEYAVVGAYAPAGSEVPLRFRLSVLIKTPGSDMEVVEISRVRPMHLLAGPATYRVYRPDISHLGVNVGVFKEV